MDSIFSWRMSNGKDAKLVATYICKMAPEIIDADGVKIQGKLKPTTAQCKMEIYIDGRRFDCCFSPNYWRLVPYSDTPRTGALKIEGLAVGLMPDVAERYKIWLDELMSAGTTAEVKAYLAECEAQKKAKEIAKAQKVVDAAKRQSDIPSPAEAKRRMKIWNNIHNEGGEGFVPHIIDSTEYNAAKRILDEAANQT